MIFLTIYYIIIHFLDGYFTWNYGRKSELVPFVQTILNKGLCKYCIYKTSITVIFSATPFFFESELGLNILSGLIGAQTITLAYVLLVMNKRK